MEIALYDRMLYAIAECHRVDEVKDLRDKARALEVYAKQAQNIQAECKAIDIRIRAERRVGQLLADLQRANTPNTTGKNQHEVMSDDWIQPPTKSEYATTLEQVGISRQNAHRYEQIAKMPDASFEAALRDREKPSTAELLRIAEAEKPIQRKVMHPPSLLIWGVMNDLDEDGFFGFSAKSLIDPMTPAMLDDMHKNIDQTINLFNSIKEYLHESA